MSVDPKIFKDYDIRGRYPFEINEEAISEIAAAIAKNFGSGAKLIIGYDARLSSPSLYKAVLRSLKEGNSELKVIGAGMITTPTLYFLVNELRTSGGIMVTASHNSKEYNGLKVVKQGARPVSGSELAQIVFSRDLIVRSLRRLANATAFSANQSRFASRQDYLSVKVFTQKTTFADKNYKFSVFYSNFLKKFLKLQRRLKVVFDCSNGTTALVLKKLFGGNKFVKAVFINDKPDGNFPAHGPNPLAKGAMRQVEMEVVRKKADLGVIFDADGDRAFFIDNLGRPVAAHEAGFLLMQLFRQPLVASVISSWRIKKLAGKSGKRRIYISRVGHYFFKRLMREKEVSLGVEPSGHFYFKKFFYCDSGILAAVEVINFVSGLKTDFASWLNGLPRYYRSGELNFKFGNKEKVLDKIEKVYRKEVSTISKIDGLLMEFDNWWFNIRSSNTEPLWRLNIEATNYNLLKKELKNLKHLIASDYK